MRTKLVRVTLVAGAALAVGCSAGGSGDDEPLGPADLIDDLEDGDDAIDATNGRLGGWYTFHDATAGTQIPPESGFVPTAGGAAGSAYAAGTSGSGFTEWGAGMGFDLNNPEAVGMTGGRARYDASRYQGLVFQARGNVAVRVALETAGVTPADRGGTCTPGTMEGQECEDLHGVTLDLTTEWQEYQVPFARLRQGGWGQAVPFDATAVTAVLFTVDQNQSFDIAVDDVRFHE